VAGSLFRRENFRRWLTARAGSVRPLGATRLGSRFGSVHGMEFLCEKALEMERPD